MSEHVAALGLGLNLTYWWHQSEYAKAFTGAALLTFDRRFNIQYDHLNLCICQTDALLCHWAYQSVTELHEPEYLLQISQNFELNILLDYTAVKIQSDVTKKNDPNHCLMHSEKKKQRSTNRNSLCCHRGTSSVEQAFCFVARQATSFFPVVTIVCLLTYEKRQHFRVEEGTFHFGLSDACTLQLTVRVSVPHTKCNLVCLSISKGKYFFHLMNGV